MGLTSTCREEGEDFRQRQQKGVLSCLMPLQAEKRLPELRKGCPLVGKRWRCLSRGGGTPREHKLGREVGICPGRVMSYKLMKTPERMLRECGPHEC